MGIESIIAGSIKDKNEIKRSIGTRDATTGIFKVLKREELDIKDRYIIVKQRNIYNDTHDSFILSHSTNGKLGTANGVGGHQIVLGDYRDSWVTQRIVNPSQTYFEWFYDSEFKDAGNTTATWDVTNHKIDFTSGQVAQSTKFVDNNQTIVSATLTAIYTGTITFQLSADNGSNWETVTENALHNFTHTGTELLWKATESGGSTAQLTELIIKYSYT